MIESGPVLQLSPTETLRAVAHKGKIGYVYEQAEEGSYEFRNGKMRVKAKPVFMSVLVQGLIPAELFRTKPDEVMAFFKAHIELCKHT